MKEKNKKILTGFLEMLGYGGAITYTTVLTWLLFQIHKYGKVSASEPNIHLLLTEMGLGISTIGFLIYKFIKSLKKREKELSDL
ncbi:hypothetical protein LCGC14_1456680 [marine sediment metagenome]|uniref:Uncharacterized protein n=1 Tax=marine sediment metagenome TaxID=412755 RepID=A0A0F9JG85_9ZZZZ